MGVIHAVWCYFLFFFFIITTTTRITNSNPPPAAAKITAIGVKLPSEGLLSVVVTSDDDDDASVPYFIVVTTVVVVISALNSSADSLSKNSLRSRSFLAVKKVENSLVLNVKRLKYAPG